MLEKLHKQERRLDRRLKSIKTWRRVSNVLFMTAFVSVLIFSAAAATIAAPPVVTALAGALSVPVGSVGKWCNALWNKYEKVVRWQNDIITSIKTGTSITIQDMENICVLVNRLEVDIESLLQKADFALSNEDAVKMAVAEIKNRLDLFTQMVEELERHASKYRNDVIKATTMNLRRIIRYPTGPSATEVMMA